MTMSNDTACMLCRSSRHTVVHAYDEPDPYERAVGIGVDGYKRQWVQCNGCGLFYSRYSRPADALDRIYLSAYRAESASWRSSTTEGIFNRIIALPSDQSETKARVGWIKACIQDLRLKGLIPAFTSPARLLDIGGATGVFAYEFRDQDWAPHIIDPSSDGAFLQSRHGIPYIASFYEPFRFDGPFDLISLVFVLEHHRDPASLLRLVQNDMTANSLLYVEVPDALCFKYKDRDDDIFNACHLWMFSPETLVRLLGNCGYDVYCLQRTKTVRGHYSLMVLGALK